MISMKFSKEKVSLVPSENTFLVNLKIIEKETNLLEESRRLAPK